VSAFGRVDILVNHVGVGTFLNVVETSYEHWDEILALNLTAAFVGTKAFLPHMVERGSGVITQYDLIRRNRGWPFGSGLRCSQARSRGTHQDPTPAKLVHTLGQVIAASASRRSSGSGSSAETMCVPTRIWTGAVAPCGADELLDRPAGACLDVAGDGERGEHDGKVGVDRFAFVVVDRPGSQVVFAHPERFPDVPELVVGADQELRGRVVDVGDVALEPGQSAGFGLELAVDGLGRAGQGDEPVAFDREPSRRRPSRLCRSARRSRAGCVARGQRGTGSR